MSRGHIVVLLLHSILGSGVAFAANPRVQSIMVTDITPRSFSVVWLATPGSSPSLHVFEAPACEVPVADAIVEAFPTVAGDQTLVNAAKSKGVSKARVSGLNPATDYCFQVVSSSISGEVTKAPLRPVRVTTATRTSRTIDNRPSDSSAPSSNDLLRFQINDPGSTESLSGTLLLARLPGVSAPVSGFVGDGIDDDANPATPTRLVLLDLNNVYRATDGTWLDLASGEAVSFLEVNGSTNLIPVHARIVPQETHLATIVDPAPCLDGARGGACDGRLGAATSADEPTNADPRAITEFVIGARTTLTCRVCADVDRDGDIDMRDALMLAQSLDRLRPLP